MRSAAFYLSLAFIFTIPWENAITIAEIGTLTKVVGVAMAVLWMGSALKSGSRRPQVFQAAMLLFMIWNVATLFWTMGFDETMESITTYIQLGIMTFIIWDLYSTPSAMRAGLQAYVLGAYVAAGATLSNYLSGTPMTEYEGRYTGAGLNANELALILSLAIPVAWHLVTVSSDRKRSHVLRAIVNLACIPVSLFAIMLTASRTALFTAVPGLLFILITSTRLRVALRITVLAALTGGALALLAQAPTTSIDRLTTTASSISGLDLGGRFEIWTDAVTLHWEHPVLGIGSGAFVKTAGDSGRVVHNTFLSVLVESGIIGFVLFAVILGLAVYRALQKPLWGCGLWLAVLLAWTIGASALTLERTKVAWLFLSLVFLAGTLIDEHEPSSSTAAH